MPTSPRPGPPVRRRQGRRAALRDDGGPDLREAILAATMGLLTDHDFSDLAVSDILTAAGVSRGTFYFYFDSKHDVLAELVRRAVAQGHSAAAPWLASPADPAAALRAGITAGAELWRSSAPVLRAIVENWRTDPRLTALWLEQMQTFTDATIAQLSADPRVLGGSAARTSGPWPARSPGSANAFTISPPRTPSRSMTRTRSLTPCCASGPRLSTAPDLKARAP